MLDRTSAIFGKLSPTPLQKRNTLADWAFYDVRNLSDLEFDFLSSRPFKEGTILVVHPNLNHEGIEIQTHDDHQQLLNAPGDMLEHFVIAGVGSSDVGAAALARTLANHLESPVGAIVAGYGVADLLQEALGGWFFFGAANRFEAWSDHFNWFGKPDSSSSPVDFSKASRSKVTNDTDTLVKLLSDKNRKIQTLLGHSKGCLSMAFALNHYEEANGATSLQGHKNIRVITLGAVVEFPEAMENVAQYLGEWDSFGGINSVLTNPFISIPHAWHHLNTEYPFHMDVPAILDGEFDEQH
jgi:hypothetical protein